MPEASRPRGRAHQPTASANYQALDKRVPSDAWRSHFAFAHVEGNGILCEFHKVFVTKLWLLESTPQESDGKHVAAPNPTFCVWSHLLPACPENARSTGYSLVSS
jgi:hypothetical protein